VHAEELPSAERFIGRILRSSLPLPGDANNPLEQFGMGKLERLGYNLVKIA